MIDEMESNNGAIGSDTTMMWVIDYRRYLANPSTSIFNTFFGIFDFPDEKSTLQNEGYLL